MNLNGTTSVNLKGTNPTPIQYIIDSHEIADRADVQSLNDEGWLDLEMSDMTEDEAEDHAHACDLYLSFKGVAIPRQELTIVEADLILFKQFLVEATKKRKGNEKYLTAMSITFGAVGDKIMPIFQSVYLKWVRYDATSQKDLYEIPSNGYGVYKKFVGGQFVTILQAERDKMFDDYKAGVKIVHKNGENPEAYRLNVDTESILIPLQIIYTVTCSTLDFKGFITHAIREVQYDSASPRKHIVMVNGVRIAAVGNPIVYANRSHLCPPCTASFGFDLA